MRDLLLSLDPETPPALRSGPAWERVLAAAAAFPALSGGMLEWHLTEGHDRLDLSVRVRAEAAERDFLLARRQWPHVRAFARRWAAPGGPLCSLVQNTWLEFDLPPAGGASPSPGFFFDLRSARKLSAKRAVAAAVTGFGALGAAVPPAYAAGLRTQLLRLPAAARLRYLGFFPERPRARPRHCLTGLSAMEVLLYLEGIGWRGDKSALAAALTEFSPGADRLQLNLDGAPAPSPSLSFELSVNDGERWPDLVERLSAAAAILAWPTYDRLPAALAAAIRDRTGRQPTWTFRRISHLKIAVAADGRRSAKAYLFFGWA